jgi:hypothetical protein
VGPIELDDNEAQALVDYCRGGGVLLVDAAGSDREFHRSFLDLAERWFDGRPELLELSAPVYNLPDAPLREVQMRGRVTQQARPRWRALRLDGRVVGLYSPDDITAGLVGYTQSGLSGYRVDDDPEQDSAYRMMRNAVLWAGLYRE